MIDRTEVLAVIQGERDRMAREYKEISCSVIYNTPYWQMVTGEYNLQTALLNSLESKVLSLKDYDKGERMRILRDEVEHDFGRRH